MALRLYVYVARVLDRWWRTNRDATHLPAVIPLVLYSGRSAWTAPLDLHGLLDLPADVLEAARPLLPGLCYAVDDLSGQTDEEIRARPGSLLGTVTLLLLSHGHDEWSATLEFLRVVGPLLDQLGDRDDWELTISYILAVSSGSAEQVLQALTPSLSPAAREVAVTAAEQLRAEGHKQGLAESLRLLLAKKFGPLDAATEQKLSAASEAELTRWTERVLDVDSLEAVFA